MKIYVDENDEEIDLEKHKDVSGLKKMSNLNPDANIQLKKEMMNYMALLDRGSYTERLENTVATEGNQELDDYYRSLKKRHEQTLRHTAMGDPEQIEISDPNGPSEFLNAEARIRPDFQSSQANSPMVQEESLKQSSESVYAGRPDQVQIKRNSTKEPFYEDELEDEDRYQVLAYENEEKGLADQNRNGVAILNRLMVGGFAMVGLLAYGFFGKGPMEYHGSQSKSTVALMKSQAMGPSVIRSKVANTAQGKALFRDYQVDEKWVTSRKMMEFFDNQVHPTFKVYRFRFFPRGNYKASMADLYATPKKNDLLTSFENRQIRKNHYVGWNIKH